MTSTATSDVLARTTEREAIERRIQELGDWFHNLDLHGVKTAPNHFLGDYPAVKWKHIKTAFPEDMQGASVLDIGCNAGFYSIELKKRGAGRVVGVDVDDRYLEQGRFAAQTLGFDIEFVKSSVYHVDDIPGQFDYVLFLGVFYHLRYPLLGLDIVAEKVGRQLLFQALMLKGENSGKTPDDFTIDQREIMDARDWPKMAFVEKRLAGDGTNWWIANDAAMQAMLRSTGMKVIGRPAHETYLCVPDRSLAEESFFDRKEFLAATGRAEL